MPYIVDDDRDYIREALNELIADIDMLSPAGREGAVVYAITEIVAQVLKPQSGWRWKSLKDARACFQEAGDEFARRLTGPYEDGAKERNGDIEAFTS